MKINFIIAIMLMSVIACKSTKDIVNQKNSAKQTITLQNKYWKLIELRGQDVVYPEGIQVVHLTFRDNGTVDGCLACNKFHGNYSTDVNNNLKISDFIGTKKFCMVAMQIENDMIEIVNTVVCYKIDDKRNLLFLDANAKLLAKFEAVDMD